MIIIIVFSEKKQRNQSTFVKTILNSENEEISCREVTMPLFHLLKDGFDYFILYNEKMEVISEVFQYLNHDLEKSCYNTRNQAAFAIRLLYCYLSLTNKDINNISEEDLKKLQYFLKGIGTINEKYTMVTIRSNSTVNGYMAVYRQFFKKRGIKCKALFRSNITTTKNYIGEDFCSITEHKKYENNLKIEDKTKETVPRYISPQDFKTIFEFVIQKKDIQAKIILHLMYGYGLRLGEVLGLTIEDIQEVRRNGKYIPILILRNRLSDKDFQYAKGLKHVTNIKEYKSTDYIKNNYEIIITYDFYEQILEYIEESHTKLMEKYPNNYNNTYADIVSNRNAPEENHYVFLNQYGRILSDQTWGNKLKKYFLNAKIPIDYDIKENNLSHRFRHGFAMFHARFSENPIGVLELNKMMRHKKLSSTLIYYNPTEDDELKIKTEFQSELYKLIPELKKGWF